MVVVLQQLLTQQVDDTFNLGISKVSSRVIHVKSKSSDNLYNTTPLAAFRTRASMS